MAKKQMFKITTIRGVMEVEGTPYSIPELPAIEMFIHKDTMSDNYTISEVTTVNHLLLNKN